MNINDATLSLRFKVGIFSVLGLLLIAAITVFVNDRPYWWRSCQLVFINVEDATGLKTKSPVRSLGLQIGYLKSVELFETHVRLGICITAPVTVLPKTRAYIRGEGFLGDKFVELKPVKYSGEGQDQSSSKLILPAPPTVYAMLFFSNLLTPACAEVQRGQKDETREIPVGEGSQDMQKLVDRVDSLVGELTDLTTNIKTAINPDELKLTMQKLNKTLENAAKTLSPQGGLTTTAQRTLAKLEDSVEQLRDLMTRINQGKGSVGMLLNDPQYAEELLQAIRSINYMLGKVSGMRIIVDVGGATIPSLEGSRGAISVSIWPRFDRYYLLGISVDPRGKLTKTTTTTTVGNVTTTTQTTLIEDSGILVTGMLGKVFWHRLDLAIGVLYGDGAVSAGVNLGPEGDEERLRLVNSVYSRQMPGESDSRINSRVGMFFFPSRSPYLSGFYVSGGFESLRKINGKMPYFAGAGVSFDDKDIKMLFSFL